MTTWFISDTHFNHENVIEFCNRPFSNIEEMNLHLILEWNEIVLPGDTVWHLGDFALGLPNKVEEICSQLNGNINLLIGNHDTNAKLEIYKDYFTIHPPLVILKNPNVILCHYPLAVWPHLQRGTPHFHGHSHGSYKGEGRILDVGVDVGPKYRPKSWEELQETALKIIPVQKDHHKLGEEYVKKAVADYAGCSGNREVHYCRGACTKWPV